MKGLIEPKRPKKLRKSLRRLKGHITSPKRPKKLATHLSCVVDVRVPLQEQGRDVLVAVVGRDVKRGEAGLRGHVRVVVAGLEQQPGGLRVVLLGRDVQGRESNLASGVVLQEDGDHLNFFYKNVISGIPNNPASNGGTA